VLKAHRFPRFAEDTAGEVAKESGKRFGRKPQTPFLPIPVTQTCIATGIGLSDEPK